MSAALRYSGAFSACEMQRRFVLGGYSGALSVCELQSRLALEGGHYSGAISACESLPSNALDLAVRNFGRELPELLKALKGTEELDCAGSSDGCSEEAAALRASDGLLWEVVSYSRAINVAEMQRRLLLATVVHSVPVKCRVGLLLEVVNYCVH